MRIVVVGGVAAGMSAASQAKRLVPSAEVVAFERGKDVSYGACGMPYNLMDPARDIDDLVVLTATQLRDERKIDLRTEHEVERIDTAGKRVRVRDLRAERVYELEYDALVLATGAEAVRPPLPGLELPGVFTLRTLSDGAHVKRYLAEQRVTRALIIGAGYIGMEMAEALHARGISVNIVEKAEQVLPGFDASVAQRVAAELDQNGVKLTLGASVQAIERAGDKLSVRTDKGKHETELVLVSVGVRPSVALAKEAGIKLGASGAITVDDHQRTNIPNVYAAGDCAEALQRVSGRSTWVPLGTTANKQGRVAGANAVGRDQRFAGIVGSAAFKVFSLEVGRTGLGAGELEKLALAHRRSQSEHVDHAPSFSAAHPIITVLFSDPKSGKLLGAQMVGRGVVGKRIDVLATALFANLSVHDVGDLDLTYAPPIAPVYDPILIAARVAEKS